MLLQLLVFVNALQAAFSNSLIILLMRAKWSNQLTGEVATLCYLVSVLENIRCCRSITINERTESKTKIYRKYQSRGHKQNPLILIISQRSLLSPAGKNRSTILYGQSVCHHPSRSTHNATAEIHAHHIYWSNSTCHVVTVAEPSGHFSKSAHIKFIPLLLLKKVSGKKLARQHCCGRPLR